MPPKFKVRPLYAKTLIGMFAGILVGPIAVWCNGTSCYQTVSVWFIAHVMGIDLGWGEIATIIDKRA